MINDNEDFLEIGPLILEITQKLADKKGHEISQIWVLLELLKEKETAYNKRVSKPIYGFGIHVSR